MTQDKIKTKLAAARTRLILDKPFLGALVLRLPMEESDPEWCPTTATDARKFYYNPAYIDALKLDEAQFMLAHEALHCALSHFARRQHRKKHRWDLACDFAINPLLVDDGLKPPPEAIVLDQFKGMTAEEIYPLIDEFEDQETLDRHAYEKDEPSSGAGQHKKETDLFPDQSPSNTPPETNPDGQKQSSNSQQGQAKAPSPLTPDEIDTLTIQWQQRMAGAAQQAIQAGKLGGEMARMVDHMLQPQLPWRSLLARYLSPLARDDFSYMRPSRREGEFIMPSLRSSQIKLVIALDTSGSISQQEIDEFLAEVNALKGQLRAHITLLACDAELAKDAPWVFEPWDAFEAPKQFDGGGGTSFRPVFKWLQERNINPELLVYFTDAEGAFPDTEPDYPVIWLIKGKNKVPWGQRIQLN